ncbi:MAG: aminotransferase class I/II-fold pyridoxal phosphate-dependent enzyme [bacterium]
MNPRLAQLQPYPFERLRTLLEDLRPSDAYAPINLSIGEPKHATPALIRDALTRSLDGLAQYPPTAGIAALREAIARWISARYAVTLDPQTQVLPINGSREALFAFAQTVIDGSKTRAKVLIPNPFYQIYEGAALLAGAQPVFLNTTAANGFRMPLEELDTATWRDVQLLYVCSPANPSGTVLGIDDWSELFALADAHDFIIASDECYSELYYDESKPPVGAAEAARALGRSSAMSPPVQHASIAAWGDEGHVRDNRHQYAEKYRAVLPRLQPPLHTFMPEGGFYLWITTPIEDTEFTRSLYREYNVLVLPGSVLARDANGENPGQNHVRVALVAPLVECVEAVERMNRFAKGL